MILSQSELIARLVKIYSLEFAKSFRPCRQMIGCEKKLIALNGFGIQFRSSNLLDNET